MRVVPARGYSRRVLLVTSVSLATLFLDRPHRRQVLDCAGPSRRFPIGRTTADRQLRCPQKRAPNRKRSLEGNRTPHASRGRGAAPCAVRGIVVRGNA